MIQIFCCSGLIVGAVIRYTIHGSAVKHIEVIASNYTNVTDSIPPDELWFWYPHNGKNKTFSYKFHSEVTDLKNNEFDLKVGAYIAVKLLKIEVCAITDYFTAALLV